MALSLLLTRYLHGSTGSEVSLMNQTAFFFYIQTSEYKKSGLVHEITRRAGVGIQY